MQLEPYHPGKLAQARRNAGALAAGITALGALTVGAVALGSALARLARPRASELDEPAERRVDKPVDEPATRQVYRFTGQALHRVDEIGAPGLHHVSVSVWMAEEWISRAGE